MIYIHLVIAALFLPLLLLMPMTGSLYLWGFSGDQEKIEAFTITETAPEGKTEQEQFFRDQFKKQNINFDFEYIKSTKTDYIFRPATRNHYMATKTDAGLVFYEMKPTLLKRLVELHKGHGPLMMRWFESLFGICLVLVTLSGLWLAVTVPAYRKATIISFCVGMAVIAGCLV